MPYRTDEEISIHVAAPTVRQTKLQVNGTIEARANTNSAAFSVHYRQSDQAPTVGEKLLVAVLSGVHDEWLPSEQPEALAEDETRIDCELVSGEHYDEGSSTCERTGRDDVDVLSFTSVDRGRTKKLHLAMTNQSRKRVYATVVLNKWQVTQMLAALLAIYPQLHED